MFTPKGRYHIFDGDGMLHGITLDGEGGARYRNRWVRTEGLAAEQRVGHAIYGGMANGDFPTPEETAGGPSMKNVANTNVIRHAGRILCLWEAGLPTEVTPALETVGPFDFGGALDRPFTAHPKLDPSTGRMYAFGYSPIPPYLSLYVVDADGTLARTIDIDLPVAGDDARLRGHRAARGVPRCAGRVRPRFVHARRTDAVVEAGARRPLRRSPARR